LGQKAEQEIFGDINYVKLKFYIESEGMD